MDHEDLKPSDKDLNAAQDHPENEDSTGAVAATDAPGKAADVSDSGDSDPGAPPVVVSEDPNADITRSLDFPVVGLGGSAGSVESFIEIFKRVSPNTGMAFVCVMHLAPDQQSHMTEIVGRQTSMPVVSLEDGMAPQPDHVYILPPDAFVTLKQGLFRLTPRDSVKPFLPVDVFFESLAKEQKGYAIGVVLSGMAGDGSLGLRTIKGEGGFSLVQSPESARHPSMPRTSIAADHVDLILDPEALGRYLSRLGRRFTDAEFQRLQQGDLPPGEEKHFARILKLLKSVSGVDFRLYKPATIQRRIARRMLMHKVDGVADYLQKLQSDTTELRTLQEDILINVTRFFRDPDVFENLKSQIIPSIFENRRNDEQIRVWVAGCSSGEEVYSLAICLLEHITGKPDGPSIQIFGTDASEANIQKARLGMYTDIVANDLSAERLRRFFIKTDKGFQVSKRVRDLCVFARQNLCTDPPFSRLDLVSCRNVLIYFGTELQRRVISTFHYALREDGYLLLGSSETIREYTDLFTVSDRVRKVFVRSSNGRGHGSQYTSSLAQVARTSPVSLPAPAPYAGMRQELDLGRMADRVVLARYGPPSVVINAKLQVVQSRGKTAPFLEMPQGTASLQLARLMRSDIAATVIEAVSRAIELDVPVHVDDLTLRDGAETAQAMLDVLPLPSGDGQWRDRHYLVVFLPQDPPTTGVAARISLPASVDRGTEQLYQDLASTKLYLSSLLDEREAHNQELISANEEIQSANEELQSTNEELETTKEELQSSNEELQTVNDELENRNSVLTQASNDLSNLLNSVNMPVLMLSNELYIRHFTPQTHRVMSVRAQDIGRPFGEIRLDLAIDDLQERLEQVLNTLTPQEIEVQDRDGRWYFLRIRPYRTTDNKIDGLVMVLVDIDQSRRSQHELREARDFAASILANTPLPLVVVNSQDKVISTNDAFCRLAGLSRPTLEQRNVAELAAVLWNMQEKLGTMLRELRTSPGGASSFEWDFDVDEHATQTLLVRGCALQPDGEKFVLVTFEDISAHKEVERLLKSQGERMAAQIADTTQQLGRSREELRALADNLMTSQEEERRRLARELHDDISQRMAVLDMNCEAALRAIESDPADAQTKVQAVKERIAAVSEDVRKLSHRLHPAILEHLGVAAALEALLDEFAAREGTLTTFHADELPERVSPDVATGLYRITQEALRNVAKHAGKAHVKVSLLLQGDELVLEVSDSGAGFSLQQQVNGLGLISMKERARLIGAHVQIESAPRQGTRIHVHVPLSRNDEERE